MTNTYKISTLITLSIYELNIHNSLETFMIIIQLNMYLYT